MSVPFIKKIKVKRSDLVDLVSRMDGDNDGYIDAAEVIKALKAWQKHVKETVKYLKD